jgi:hypothetical protein
VRAPRDRRVIWAGSGHYPVTATAYLVTFGRYLVTWR